jgi:hypothetical protein
MACVGAPVCHFFNYSDQGPGRYTKVEWKQETWDRIYHWLYDFLWYVENDQEPPRLAKRRTLQD